MFSYQWTINLWTQHILELSKEAINNIIIGNFFSLGSLNRTIIECFVYSYCIKHFEEEKLWESWIYYNINKKLENKFLDNSYRGDIILTLNKLKSCRNKKGENEWLRDVVPKHKNKRISFRDICDLVQSKEKNIKYIYKNYQEMCDYVHGTDLTIKLFNFMFYDIYYPMILIMFEYLSKSLLNLSDNQVSKLKLQSIAYEFYDLIHDILND